MPPYILIVEDEQDISELLKAQLQSQGHETKVISNGQEALNHIQAGGQGSEFDLYILDRMLPGVDGLEICKFLRLYDKTKHNPILMVTAMTRPEQIVEGLDAGADDYITKPFDMDILLARTRSLLRRSQQITQSTPTQSNTLLHGQIKIDTEQCKVWLEDDEIQLTLSEYKLLCIFLQNPGKVHTRTQLVEFVQDGPVHVTERTIDTHIFGLRKKLGNHSSVIETIRGIGYRVANAS